MSSSGTGKEAEPRCAACQYLQQLRVPGCHHPERLAAVHEVSSADDVARNLRRPKPGPQLTAGPQQQQQSAAAGGAVVPPPCRVRQPCAACQHLRRPCPPNCDLAPHFPPGDDPARFAAAVNALVRQAVAVVNVVIRALLEANREDDRLRLAAVALRQLNARYREEAASARFVPEQVPQEVVAARHDRVQAATEQVPAGDSLAGVTSFETPMDQKWADGVIGALLEAEVPGSSTGVTAAFPEPAATMPAFLMQQPPPPAPTAATGVQDAGLPDLNSFTVMGNSALWTTGKLAARDFAAAVSLAEAAAMGAKHAVIDKVRKAQAAATKGDQDGGDQRDAPAAILVAGVLPLDQAIDAAIAGSRCGIAIMVQPLGPLSLFSSPSMLTVWQNRYAAVVAASVRAIVARADLSVQGVIDELMTNIVVIDLEIMADAAAMGARSETFNLAWMHILPAPVNIWADILPLVVGACVAAALAGCGRLLSTDEDGIGLVLHGGLVLVVMVLAVGVLSVSNARPVSRRMVCVSILLVIVLLTYRICTLFSGKVS
ncbi:hypothetical protein EJB05_15085 [Eragrostis curvula]|uniref:LOB domain-containing protein n=1 Tax=Eragrostis curvula TaxID=38414 RepID=A0A5J9W0X1_9POAL|nr:hypothetical protein EJB05_15085 [Eragrostis curvula]